MTIASLFCQENLATPQGKDRRYLKGQKYTLLSQRANLTSDARRNLKILLAANKRLNTAYLLKESFGQLWNYKTEGWARRFFENWRAALKWQRLTPYEKFADLVDRHWDGIAAYCHRQQGRLGICRRLEQQDSGYPTARLRAAGRGVSAAEDPHLYASRDLKLCAIYPLTLEKSH